MKDLEITGNVGLNSSFQRDVVRSSGSHNVTLFGNRVVVDIISSSEVILGLGVTY